MAKDWFCVHRKLSGLLIKFGDPTPCFSFNKQPIKLIWIFHTLLQLLIWNIYI